MSAYERGKQTSREVTKRRRREKNRRGLMNSKSRSTTEMGNVNLLMWRWMTGEEGGMVNTW